MGKESKINKIWRRYRPYSPEGAFLFLALKGFKGKFDDIYIKYYYINFITSWIIRAIVFYFLFRDRGFTW